MFADFQYAYLVGNFLIGLPLWVFLFVYRKDLRKEILISSALIGILAPLWSPWFIKDYWHPESLNFWRLGAGDFMYGFFFGGIANVIYEEIFGKHYAKRKNRKHHWSWFILPFAALGVLVFNIPVLLGINSIYAAITTFVVLSSVMVYFRRDLLIDTLMSGVLVGLITLLGYVLFLALFPGIVHAWWKLSNLSGIFVMGVPIEELLWAFGLGMVAGPFYEFFMGLRFKKS